MEQWTTSSCHDKLAHYYSIPNAVVLVASLSVNSLILKHFLLPPSQDAISLYLAALPRNARQGSLHYEHHPFLSLTGKVVAFEMTELSDGFPRAKRAFVLICSATWSKHMALNSASPKSSNPIPDHVR